MSNYNQSTNTFLLQYVLIHGDSHILKLSETLDGRFLSIIPVSLTIMTELDRPEKKRYK